MDSGKPILNAEAREFCRQRRKERRKEKRDKLDREFQARVRELSQKAEAKKIIPPGKVHYRPKNKGG